ncbi:hypothetical protein BC629DRAFT_1437977 [Irpex lacteus]|nr:hypothetical protein BC629DRAFT_1437977 [Irpex lacteus]
MISSLPALQLHFIVTVLSLLFGTLQKGKVPPASHPEQALVPNSDSRSGVAYTFLASQSALPTSTYCHSYGGHIFDERWNLTMTLPTQTPVPVIVPSMFLPGATVTFTGTAQQSMSDKPTTITFTIVHVFHPFTKSVTLRVCSQQLGSEDVILKIYDPRFTDERRYRKPYKPWNSATETLASTMYEPGHYVDKGRYDDSPDPEDLAGVAARDALWEACYRDTVFESYENECRAYRELIELQGTAIPRFLFSGTIHPNPDDERRAIEVPAIVLEYIPDAVSMAKLPEDALTVDLCVQLVKAVDKFPRYGVIHDDLHLENILFTPRRVVIIDFGCAGFKEEGEGEEEWTKAVSFIGDRARIRRHLEAKNKTVWEMVPEDVRKEPEEYQATADMFAD